MTWPSASHFSSDRHLNDVTVTSSKWRADGQSQWSKKEFSKILRSDVTWSDVTCENLQKNFSMPNDVKLLKTQKWSKKIFSKILRCDVTWSDGQMAMSLEVTSLLLVMSMSLQVTVTSSSDEQMVEAKDSVLLLSWIIDLRKISMSSILISWIS